MVKRIKIGKSAGTVNFCTFYHFDRDFLSFFYLNMKDIIRMEVRRMYKYNKNFFEVINTEDKAYWAGFIAADGGIRQDFGKTRIELNIRDYHHLEKYRDSINGNQPIAESVRPKNHSCYIDTNCKKIGKDLYNLGITPKKSLTLQIDFSKIPQDLWHHFIRGYFDGDGSLNKYKRENHNYYEWEFSLIGTQVFLNDVLTIFHKERKLYTCGNNWRFGFRSKSDINDILDFLYQDATMYLDRKLEKVLEFKALNDYQVPSHLEKMV